MHQGPCLELQQGLQLIGLWVLGEPVLLVLGDCVLDALGQVGLELSGCDRQAVHKQHQVEALLVVQAEVQLSDAGEAVLLVPGPQLGVLLVRRTQLAEEELGVAVFEAVTQQMQGAVLVQLLGHPLGEHGIGLTVVPLFELGPLGGLGLLHKAQEVLHEQGLRAAVGGGVFQVGANGPAVGCQVGAELVFEDTFGVDVGEVGHGRG